MFAQLFTNEAAAPTSGRLGWFRTGSAVLMRFGFMSEATDKRYVGILHQQVQKAVREELLVLDGTGPSEEVTYANISTEWGVEVVAMVQALLHEVYAFDSSATNNMIFEELRNMTPSVGCWCDYFCDVVQSNRACALRSVMVRVLQRDGMNERALELSANNMRLRQRILPKDHPHIAMSMNNLACSHDALGNHTKALRLRKDTLSFQQRILPEDHPSIATSMNNLASSHHEWGNHTEALRLRKDTFSFQQRILPKDHPHIAISMGHLAGSHDALGNHTEALRLRKDTLSFRQRILPKDHPSIAIAIEG